MLKKGNGIKMNQKQIIKKIEGEKPELKKLGVKKIGLFGSFIKGKQTKKSDVDVLVTFEKIEFDGYMEVLSLLERLFKRKVDLVIEKNLVPELKYVRKEAKYVEL